MTARCWVVRMQLPSGDDLGSLPTPLRAHAASCLRCQAESARYRSMRRRLEGLASVVEMAPSDLAGGVAAALDMPELLEAPKTGAARAAVAAAAGAAIVAGAAVLLGRRFIKAA